MTTFSPQYYDTVRLKASMVGEHKRKENRRLIPKGNQTAVRFRGEGYQNKNTYTLVKWVEPLSVRMGIEKVIMVLSF